MTITSHTVKCNCSSECPVLILKHAIAENLNVKFNVQIHQNRGKCSNNAIKK